MTFQPSRVNYLFVTYSAIQTEGLKVQIFAQYQLYCALLGVPYYGETGVRLLWRNPGY